MNKKTFNSRSFLSIGAFLFFVLLSVSGIVLHAKDDKPYDFSKIFFIVAHNVSAVIFLIFSIGHILKNRKAIKSYMSGSAKKMISREMLMGMILLIVILVVCYTKAMSVAVANGIV